MKEQTNHFLLGQERNEAPMDGKVAEWMFC